MSSLEEKRKQILELVSEYIAEKEGSSWNREDDWVTYSGPFFDYQEYVAAIDTMLDGWLIFGKKARQFEIEFPKNLGKKLGVLTNSGSSANLLMTAAAIEKYNLKRGDKFITPVVCFPTTINPMIQQGLKPVFIDVTLPSLNLDLDQVEKVLENDPEIKGIIFAHVLGNPPNMDRLMSIVKKHNLIFLEDACDSLGSFYDDKKLGSFGDMSTCSFFPAHHMTMGEGGFVATDSNSIGTKLSSLRDWGRGCYCNTMKPGPVVKESACGDRFRNWLPGMPEAVVDHRYVFSSIGYNLKPLEMQAAIGLEQLKKLPEMDAARRRNFKILSKIFSKYGEYFYLPKAEEKSDPCWFGYLLTIKKSACFSREQLVRYFESNRIQTRSYFSGNITAHPGYIHLKDGKEFPIADLVTTNSFFLGTFAGIDKEKLDHIEKVLESFLSSIDKIE